MKIGGLDEALDEMAREVGAGLDDDLRGDVSAVFTYVQNAHTRRAPVASGRYRSELQAYSGTMPEGELYGPDKPYYPPPGHDQIDATLDTWEPGLEIGYVDNAPHAERLSEGWSEQAPEGWIDAIAEEAVKL